MIYPHLDLRFISAIVGIYLILSHGVALLVSCLRRIGCEVLRPRNAGLKLLVIDAVSGMILVKTMDLGEFTYLARLLQFAVIIAATFLDVPLCGGMSRGSGRLGISVAAGGGAADQRRRFSSQQMGRLFVVDLRVRAGRSWG